MLPASPPEHRRIALGRQVEQREHSPSYLVTLPLSDVNIHASPGLSMFYDWQGSILFQPNLRFARDPWRLVVDYTAINSGVFRPPLGFVRDRGNVRLQVEYVL